MNINLLEKLRERPHWSLSSLNCFLNVCSLQWAFKYVYNLEPESTPVALVFGSAFHKAAAFIAENRMNGHYPDICEIQDAIPSCDILNVLNEFYSPSHPEFGEYNYWSLYNSFTETAKKYSFPRADKCYRKIGKLFGLT